MHQRVGTHYFDFEATFFFILLFSVCSQVIAVTGHQLHVQYLRRHKTFYIFPDVEDEDEIDVDSVSLILKEPEIARRGHMFFKELEELEDN